MTTRIAACSCGQLSASVEGEPSRISVCHCLACQRRTGGVFATQARFADGQVSVTGEATEFVRIGGEGSHARFRFCPRCGCTVYYTVDEMPGVMIIPVGAFADPSFPAPTVSVFEERMHSWVAMPEAMEHFA